MMDALREYFCNTYGITKIPLLYVVREEEASRDEPEGHCEDPMMQMIDRAPLDPSSWRSVTPVMRWITRWCLTNWQKYVAPMVAGHTSNHFYADAMVNQHS